MAKPLMRVAITGGGGQIAYSLLFRIAAGELLGRDQPVALHIVETPSGVEALKGVAMELEDCAYPLLKEVKIGDDPLQLFKEIDIAILIGARPRGPGMERKDLLGENGKIFITQGNALNAVANPDVLVFVVGNPCNTNALIALHHAPRISPKRFFGMTRLDQNRAVSMLANKSHALISEVNHVTIWGNHSSTQVADFSHAKIRGRPAIDVIKDRAWLENDFFPGIQKRGAAVIAARGKSSAGSAAQAILDGIRSLVFPTPEGDWFSCGIYSKGNPYGIDPNLIFSFPCTSKGGGKVEIVKDLKWDRFIKEKIKMTELELIEERLMVSSMLKNG